MKRYILLIALLCLGFSLQAQNFLRNARQVFKASTSSKVGHSLAVARAEHTAARIAARQQALVSSFQPIKLMLDSPKADMKASSFFLQETYQGKKYLWGVTVSHYNFTQAVMEGQGGRLSPVHFIARGNSGLNDVTVFAVPAGQAKHITALKLASTPPKVGDSLHSLGYFNDKLNHETNRIVQAVYPHQIITSLQVASPHSREGACGGPVLDKNNQVVGIHAGSSYNRQIGFVIPAEHIRQLLQAYHEGLTKQPLLFNGEKIGELSLHEAIVTVDAYRGIFPLRTLQLYHKQHLVDYNHLENLIDISGANKLVFTFVQTPFLVTTPAEKPQVFTLTYHLKTKKTSLHKKRIFGIF